MDLIPNATFCVLPDPSRPTTIAPGIYRVILDDPKHDLTVAVLIQGERPDNHDRKARKTGRPRSEVLRRPRKVPSPPMVGTLSWMARSELLALHASGLLGNIAIKRLPGAYLPPGSPQEQGLFESRVKGMTLFFDLNRIQESVLVHRGLGGLVKETVLITGWTKSTVYKLWSLLCRHGFEPISLRPSRDRCGARGKPRPVDEGGRRKAGRKTTSQRIAKAFGKVEESRQPGTSTIWIARVLAIDSQIPSPKPSMPARCKHIVEKGFAREGVEVDGRIELIKPALGEYPNDRQIARILTEHKPKLERLRERTTQHHMTSAMRGLNARSWEGIAGPGHTWVIDSTVGDIYLRSSVNRAWIIGRPIVYIVVDGWSTAVVGFHVCLEGPKWDTAKVSLFNSVASPELIGKLWGYQPVITLNPLPSMCHNLLCDRGEYLSKAHRETAIQLLPVTSYTPPYRGDLKGVAEVLHRIEKDAQFMFIPGAMNYRRQELELRKSKPNESVLTMREYVHWLHYLFANYNLTADRRHRIDAHMAAAKIDPSPAGLWSWGHQMGIGYRKHSDQSNLIQSLLPQQKATIHKDGIHFLNCIYSSPEVIAEQWTTLARNFGSSSIAVNHYEGSMSRIWTPNSVGDGLLELSISDQTKASPELSYYEHLDAAADLLMRSQAIDHANTMMKIDFMASQAQLVSRAKALTLAAEGDHDGNKPTISEARNLEVGHSVKVADPVPQMPLPSVGAAKTEHEAMMNALLKSLS